MLYNVKCTRMYSAKLFGSLEAEKMASDFFYTVFSGVVNAMEVKFPEVCIEATSPGTQSDIQDDEWRVVTDLIICTYIEEEKDDAFYDEASEFFEMLLGDTRFEWKKVRPQ